MNCTKCGSEHSYLDRDLWVCPECGHEWNETANEVPIIIVRDANGNTLNSGDHVTIIKDLKVKGSSSAIKVGTKIKNIRVLDEAEDGHNISCKVEGFGLMNLKSEFVRKITD